MITVIIITIHKGSLLFSFESNESNPFKENAVSLNIWLSLVDIIFVRTISLHVTEKLNGKARKFVINIQYKREPSLTETKEKEANPTTEN
jgi:hypothetical protein